MVDKKSKSIKEQRVVLNYNFAFFTFILSLVLALCSCAVVDFATPELPPYNKEIAQSYDETKLKESSSADVLSTIYLPKYELLSQSKSVVASLGRKKRKGYKMWLKMVTFDENDMLAKRKYLFIEDERPKFLFVEPWEGAEFECEMVLDKEVLEEPYANDNAKRIAILKDVKENVRKDIDEVGSDNKNIAICGMIINQGLEAALVQLDQSPILATKLDEPSGLGYSHMSFNKGKIRMVLTDDIVEIKMTLGSFAKRWKVDVERALEVTEPGVEKVLEVTEPRVEKVLDLTVPDKIKE